MTALIGASVLCIAASAIVLVIGWANASESMIWTSIVASAAAAVLLALAYWRGRTQPATATAPAEPREETSSVKTVAAEPVREEQAPAQRGAAPKRKPAVKPSEATARPAAAVAASAAALAETSRPESAPPQKATTKPDSEVVAVAERKRFHRPDCRYAKARGGETMTRTAARRKGYAPCAVCKP